MKCAASLLTAYVAFGAHVDARTVTPHPSAFPVASSHSAPPPTPPAARPAPPLPMLPSVARVRVETGRDRLLVYEDVSLPRGEWQSGSLDLFVAFGAPGAPIAMDARLLAAQPSRDGPSAGDVINSIAIEAPARALPSVNVLLGTRKMAGAIAHLRDADLRQAFAAGGSAILRLRALLAQPASDPAGARDVVVRLGAPQGAPLTLGAIEVVSIDRDRPIARVEAELCGPDADPRPLMVFGRPNAPAVGRSAALIEPSQAIRHTSDDLCIRWWTR